MIVIEWTVDAFNIFCTVTFMNGLLLLLLTAGIIVYMRHALRSEWPFILPFIINAKQRGRPTTTTVGQAHHSQRAYS